MLLLEQKVTFQEYINQCQSLSYSERIKQENDTYWGIDGGFYANYLGDWLDIFGDSLKILFFDDLKKDSQKLIVNILNWLMIDDSIVNKINFQVENKSINYKNPFLQRFALYFNSNLEQFWRANPLIKKYLRDLYHKINGRAHQEEIEDLTREKLQQIYENTNQKLAKILIDAGYTNLPEWLMF